jgi:inosine-uridine nucleoside N-ribohydrolase
MIAMTHPWTALQRRPLIPRFLSVCRIGVMTVCCTCLVALVFAPAILRAEELLSLGNRSTNEPLKVILDTDIGPDCDDVGAVAVLHELADQGKVEILAMAVCSGEDTRKWGPPCLDALNTYFQRPDLPIGVIRKGGVGDESKYNRQIATEFENDLKDGANAEEATTLYRKTLAAQPDASVVIVSIGYLSNLRYLLESTADEHSQLNGVGLVKQKVKTYVCMGGTFPKGREWNIHRDVEASKIVIRDWPTPIYFSGFEIGEKIMTGPPAVRDDADAEREKKTAIEVANESDIDPVTRAYRLYTGGEKRNSWDQTAVWFAVEGLNGGLAEVWEISKPGKMELAEDGSNTWKDQADGSHFHLLQKMQPEKVAVLIDQKMFFKKSKSR